MFVGFASLVSGYILTGTPGLMVADKVIDFT